MDTNGHNPELDELRPRKRQRQVHDPAHGIPIHPDLQNPESIALHNAIQIQPQQAFRQNLQEFPRRRAIVACEICRARKTRCDGGKPKCRLCTELGADCNYREPGQKLDAGDKLILDQLHRIEGLLHSFGQNDASRQNRRNRQTPQLGYTLFDETSEGVMAVSLLRGPQNPSDLVEAESTRAKLTLATQNAIDPSQIASKIETYFHRLHESHAIINPNTWQAVYATASLNGFGSGLESCTVLLVAALGSCAAERPWSTENLSPDQAPGVSFFAKAWTMLPEISLSSTTLAVQCLVLASHYLLEIYRPMDAWNTLTMAVSKLQFQLISLHKQGPAEAELMTRLHWNIQLLTWSISTSLSVPLPLETLGAHFPTPPNQPKSLVMPSYYPANDQSDDRTNDSTLLVAQIELQQLEDRVSNTLPDTQRDRHAFDNIDSLVSVAVDLEVQLIQWYDRLPDYLRFSHDGFLAGDHSLNSLRLRFFACRAAIFRPFVLALAFVDSGMEHLLSALVTINSKKCLEASVRQIEYTSAIRSGQLDFKTANDIAAETLFIMGATTNAALAAMLPPPEELKQRLIDPVIAELNKLGSLSPILALKVERLVQAETKRQSLAFGQPAEP